MTMAGPDGMTFGDRQALKQHEKAKSEIEKRYCNRCKKRFEKIVTNDYLKCMRIYKKINNRGRYKGIRCKGFKKIGPI